MEVIENEGAITSTNRRTQILGTVVGGLALGWAGRVIGRLSGSRQSRTRLRCRAEGVCGRPRQSRLPHLVLPYREQQGRRSGRSVSARWPSESRPFSCSLAECDASGPGAETSADLAPRLNASRPQSTRTIASERSKDDRERRALPWSVTR